MFSALSVVTNYFEAVEELHWVLEKRPIRVVPFNLWTLAKSALIPYRSISIRAVSGVSDLQQAPNIIQWKSDIWFSKHRNVM